MSSKTGRPRVDNPKELRFSIRLDNVIAQRLDNYCGATNKKKAEIIRMAICLFLDEYEKK